MADRAVAHPWPLKKLETVVKGQRTPDKRRLKLLKIIARCALLISARAVFKQNLSVNVKHADKPDSVRRRGSCESLQCDRH